jgi:two-component system, LytTR family, response regulator
MIAVVIIESEKLARESLLRLIEKNFSSELSIIGLANTLKEGLEIITKKTPNLVFLNIELPDENGLRLFDYFAPVPFEVILTSSHEHYAINAIKYSTLDYLIKPIGITDIRAAIIRYQRKKQKEPLHQQVKVLLESMKMGKPFIEKIALPTMDSFQVIRIDDILYCSASENYSYVYMLNGEYYLVTRSLKALEEILPVDTFFRIHKSTLLNLNYVKSYSRKDGYIVTLENGIKFDVANRRQEEFTNIFLKRTSIISNIEQGKLLSN